MTRRSAGSRRRIRRPQKLTSPIDSRPPPLEDEEGRDQEAGEDEERVDAEEAALRPLVGVVVRHDRQHGERADAVERGLIFEPGVALGV